MIKCPGSSNENIPAKYSPRVTAFMAASRKVYKGSLSRCYWMEYIKALKHFPNEYPRIPAPELHLSHILKRSRPSGYLTRSQPSSPMYFFRRHTVEPSPFLFADSRPCLRGKTKAESNRQEFVGRGAEELPQ